MDTCWYKIQTADWIQNVDQVQNVDCRLQSGYKIQTENLKIFFTWYVITCHLTTYWVLCNPFTAISFNDYLHYCVLFLAHFLIKIDLYIILSLHIVFSFYAWVVWYVCTDFTNIIKVTKVIKCNNIILIIYFYYQHNKSNKSRCIIFTHV